MDIIGLECRVTLDVVTATSVLQQRASDIRSQRVNWRSYLQSQMISQEDFNFITNLETTTDEKRGLFLQDNRAQCAKTFFNLLGHISKDQTLQYLLVMIDDLFQEDKSRVEIFKEYSKKKKESVWSPFLNLLNRPDGFIMNMTSRIIAKMACWGKELMDGSDLHFYLTWLKDQMRSPGNEYMQAVARCLQMLLRIDEYRFAFVGVDGISTLVTVLSGKVNFQIQYQLTFCLWVLTFNPMLAEKMNKFNVIPILGDILSESVKEKVTRMLLAVLRNLLEKPEEDSVKRENCLAMVQCKVLKHVELLQQRSFEDEELKQDIEFVIAKLQASVQDLSSFDEYSSEVKSGRLEWSPVHRSDRFWRENAGRLNDKNYELLKILIHLLETSKDPLVLCVANHDIGEYVRHYPRGKHVLEQLGGKTLVMTHLTHTDPNVRYEALLAVQKLMVHNWEYLGRQLEREVGSPPGTAPGAVPAVARWLRIAWRVCEIVVNGGVCSFGEESLLGKKCDQMDLQEGKSITEERQKSVLEYRSRLQKGAGPWGVPFLGYAPFLLGTCFYEKFHHMKKKYGDVFYMYLAGKDLVILGEGSIIRDAFSKPNLNDRCDLVMFRQFASGSNGLLATSGKLWHENRRFTMKVLREFGIAKAPQLNAMILQEVLKICEIIKRNKDNPQDLQHPINVAIINMIWKLTAGKQFEYDDSELKDILDRLTVLTEDVLSMGPFHVCPSLLQFWSPVRRAYERLVKGIFRGPDFDKLLGFMPFSIIAKEVEKHRQPSEGKAPSDYIDAYLQQMKELEKRGESNPNFTEFQLWANVSDLFFAGSESTTHCIRWCILFLLRHPDKQEILQSEVDQIVGKDRLPSLDDRHQLTNFARVEEKKDGSRSLSPIPLGSYVDCTWSFVGFVILSAFGVECGGGNYYTWEPQISYCVSFVMNVVDMSRGYEMRPEIHDQVSEEAYTNLLVSSMVILLAFIIFDSLLIHGVRKGKRKLMIPWLALELLALITGIIIFVVVFLMLIGLLVMTKNGLFFIIFIVVAVVFLIAYSIAVHFFLVVYSHFKELENLDHAGGEHGFEGKQENFNAEFVSYRSQKQEV
ncbi:unnamed protein product [Darwinula stevensoni]|uniref:V-type proton ATPase subunit H n=1 Tax=Darwinula stevensoni TaxID=69355 RepID=A0A7R8X781_9CRUS|nr:unnamed protein product [Darwinula stevensoni]CAG0882037.1 unnamed protein product [Darwinula stevensoni]